MSRKRNRSRKQRKVGFWGTLEKYSYLRISQLPVKWEWVGVVIAIATIIASITGGYFKSSTLFGNRNEVIRWIAAQGDYSLATKLYEKYQGVTTKVLGAETQLEEAVYPERKLQHEIERQEELLIKYPNSRDILLSLSRLYKELGKMDRAQQYWERARTLDPNNPIFN